MCFTPRRCRTLLPKSARKTANQLHPWLDEEDLIPGQLWKQEIPKAVRASDVVIVCLSGRSITKEGYVQKEIKDALDVADEKPEGTIFLIPLKLEECQIPERLERLQWCNLFEERGYKKLHSALRARASALDVSSPPATRAPQLRRQEQAPVEKQAKAGVGQQNSAEVQQKQKSKRSKIRRPSIWIGIIGMLAVAVLVLRSYWPPTPLPKEIKGQDGKEMVLIPAGQFLMGCNQTVDYKCDDDEKTEEQSGKTISLGAFYIDKYEVTVAEYQRCVEAKEKGCTPPHIGGFCNWPKTGRENLPMNCVDWNQATAYCEWAGKQLPTEAQWEKAARGTDGRVYPWGNEWDAKKANVGDNNGTVAVGLYSPGANGLYDMAGNVWEWVQDWYGADYYKSSPDRNPKGPSKGDSKVLRGGSWGYDPWGARVSARHKKAPSYRSDLIGFRCAQ